MAQRRIQHPCGQLADKAVCFGDANHGGGANRVAFGGRPAEQRFNGATFAGAEINLRLVVDFELVGANRLAQ